MVVVGIDLGTTNSMVAFSSGNKTTVIENDQSDRFIPSCVAFTEDARLVGDAALHQMARNPESTIYGSKRFLILEGKKANQLIENEMLPFIVEGEKDTKCKFKVKYKGSDKSFFVEEILATIFLKLKETAEICLGKQVDGAVLTVPTSFNASHRKAIIDAASIAGIPVLGLLNEAIAAAIMFGQRLKEKNRTVLIIHLGGGTFDATILSINGTVYEVKATAGMSDLGGGNFTNKLLQYCLTLLKKDNQEKLRKNKKALARLWRACDKAKADLNLSDTVRVKVDSLLGNIDFECEITEDKFEEINSELIELMTRLTNEVVSNVNKDMIDDILLVGAATRMKSLKTIFEKYGKEKIRRTINTNEAAVMGAAVQAAVLSGKWYKDIVVRDNLSHDLSITYDNQKEISFPRQISIPVQRWITLGHGGDSPKPRTFEVTMTDGKLIGSSKVKSPFLKFGLTSKHVEKSQSKSFLLLCEMTSDGTLTVQPNLHGGQVKLQYYHSNLSEEMVKELRLEAEMYKKEDNEQEKFSAKLYQLEQNIYQVQEGIQSHQRLSSRNKAKERWNNLLTAVQNQSIKDVGEINEKEMELNEIKDMISGEYSKSSFKTATSKNGSPADDCNAVGAERKQLEIETTTQSLENNSGTSFGSESLVPANTNDSKENNERHSTRFKTNEGKYAKKRKGDENKEDKGTSCCVMC